MPASVLPAAQFAVTAALVAWMATGFTRLPGRWLRWKMFCRATFTIVVTLTGTRNGRTEPVNVYTYLSPGSFLWRCCWSWPGPRWSCCTSRAPTPCGTRC
ncbi:hypothetical protein [Streptomyces viridosporus]|uniref:hypothetical protein n=1 Tax=Streptomyces viridosporus TaxID=67581 RepID=UPI002100088E|nr:hypothetical protein [Streptomyces viridosporus]